MSNRDYEREQKKYLAISLAAVLVTAFILLQPIQASFAQQINPLSVQKFGDCTARPLYEDPIVMNVVAGLDDGPISKTVHAEKEVYDCFLDQGNVSVIVDVTIYAEIYQNMNTQSVVRKQVEVITCVKNADVASPIGCEKTEPPGATIVTTGCTENFDITHPMEMGTVVEKATSGTRNTHSIANTVEAQKEVFECDFAGGGGTPIKKVDVVLFTTIWEDINSLSTNPVFKKTVLALTCITNLEAVLDFTPIVITDTIKVESCRYSGVSL